MEKEDVRREERREIRLRRVINHINSRDGIAAAGIEEKEVETNVSYDFGTRTNEEKLQECFFFNISANYPRLDTRRERGTGLSLNPDPQS